MSDRARGATWRRYEWISLAAAIVIAHLFYWRIVLYPSAFDASNYFDIAADIESNGLFSKFYYSDLRTFGYPLLLAALVRAANLLRVTPGWLVFEAQLASYVLASCFFRHQLARLWPKVASLAFAGILLNVFALSYTPESLTESVSLSLILIAAGSWLAFAAGPANLWPALVGSLAIGAAVMMRPANLFALLAWLIGVAAVCISWRSNVRALGGVVAMLALGTALPMLPQYVNNVRYYGQHTPLVAARLAHNQQIWGIAYLKYATALPPVPNPSIFYENPFAKGRAVDGERPLMWYVQNPGAGALTLGLHTFGMLDQDLLFTYARTLDPWYRVPLGIANHALIGTAFIAIGMLLIRVRRDRRYAHAATALVGYVAAHIALHSTSAVEMRFGLPLLLLAFPAALVATREILHSKRRLRVGALASIAVIGYVAVALTLSDWVRQQAPSIRAWEAAETMSRAE